jgi:iron complex outermembrane receptor protein
MYGTAFKYAVCGTASLIALIAASAHAQDQGTVDQSAVAASAAPAAAAAPEEAAAAQTGLEDIVVTGRKRARAETLQNTPLAVTALGAAQLQSAAVKDLVDIGRMTPNASLQSSAQRGNQNFSIRGMGVSGSTVSDEPAVGIIQDGVYWGTNYGALNQLLDLEGVEILRGPQGTLFGRNVTGGAVVLRSARPTNEFSGKASIGLGNIGFREAVGVINVPIVDETLAARVATQFQQDHGYLDDTVRDNHFGGTKQYVVRPSVKWTPSADLDVTLIGEYYRLRGDPVGARGISPATIPGLVTLPTREGYVTPDKFWAVSPDTVGFSHIDVYSGVAEINWHALGGVITSITGYRNVRTRVQTDYDGTPSQAFLQNIRLNQHQFSEELRYAADLTEWLDVTSGVYYFNQKASFGESRDLNNHVTQVGTRSNLKNESYAIFAEADLKPLEGLAFTLGGRYTHETKDAETAPFGPACYDLVTCTYSAPGHYSGNNFSPKIGVSYKLDPTKLVYASFTKGFRSGGFSLRGTPLAAPYDAETVKAYEVGLKTDWFDHRLRFNVSAYQNDFSNLQRTVIAVDPNLGVIQSVFNAANATIKGFEVELTAVIANDLTLSANYGYTHARYQDFLGFANPEKLRFVRVPANTINLAADYSTEIGDGDKIAAHIGGAFTDTYFWDDANTPVLKTPSYWLVSSTLSYTIKDKYTVSLFGKNLLNEKYSVWGSNLGALGQNAFPESSRTYGVRVGVQF